MLVVNLSLNKGKKLRLGKRLKKIESMVVKNYDHIWDCCCDHGLLGAALLARQAAPYIHFVDIVPALMSDLAQKLNRFFPVTSLAPVAWQVHCTDASTLPLKQYTGRHLVIIAGVGGNLTAKFVQAICQQNSCVEIDFLLCPTLDQFALRQQLMHLNFNLLAETLMLENQRFYEIILVSNTTNIALTVSPVGSLIWQADIPEQSKVVAGYLSKTIAHYKRMQLKSGSDVQHILDAYSAIVV